MANLLRKSPPVCLLISLIKLLLGRLRISKEFIGKTVEMEDGEKFTIFRHIKAYPNSFDEKSTIFIVRFKFSKLSHKTNKFISQFPMLLITGFPGFRTKIYAVNKENGYWQGMYQWKSKKALEEYKKSLVLKIMNKRAIKSSVRYTELDNQQLIDYVEKNKIKNA